MPREQSVRRDFAAWLAERNYDGVCLQEIKVEEDLLTGGWFAGYDTYSNAARQSGHKGVTTLVR